MVSSMKTHFSKRKKNLIKLSLSTYGSISSIIGVDKNIYLMKTIVR